MSRVVMVVFGVCQGVVQLAGGGWGHDLTRVLRAN